MDLAEWTQLLNLSGISGRIFEVDMVDSALEGRSDISAIWQKKNKKNRNII